MPRKGQHIKGKWLSCEFCKKEYWAQNSRINKWKPRFCSENCRNKGISKAHKFKNKIIYLYNNNQWSINRIDKYLGIKSRESIQNLLFNEGIKIRPRKYYLERERNPNFKGGYITSNGYRRIGKEMEHRTIMSKYLKRKLEKNEHVHHLNGNKTDNRIENLSLLTAKPHGRKSAKQYSNWKEMYQSRIAFLESIINKRKCDRNTIHR
jgi:hypothetical protein